MSAAEARPLRGFIAVLVAVYCVKQILVAFIFPPFTGHDEVAHFQNVRILAVEGRLPTLFRDTLPNDLAAYNRYTLGWPDPELSSAPLYTALHPPLYYTLMVPVFRAAGSWSPVAQQYLLRCAAIPFGVLGVLCAFGLTRTLFPGDTFLAITVPTLIAFQPQISYEAAMVNNDIVAIAAYSALLYLLVRGLRDGITFRYAALVGAVFGLGLLAKTTTATALPLIVGCFWFSRRTLPWHRLLGRLVVAGAITAAMVSPWYLFMYRTYGDFSGLGELSRIQADLVSDASFTRLLFSGDFLVSRWEETWGEFGWKLIPIAGWLLSTTAAITVTGGVGLAIHTLAALREPETRGMQAWQWKALVMLGAASLLSYLAVVQFGTQFILTQARYFFPVGNAVTLLTMFGLRAWIAPRWRGVAQIAIVVGVLALNVIIYTAHVIPYWYFRQ